MDVDGSLLAVSGPYRDRDLRGVADEPQVTGILGRARLARDGLVDSGGVGAGVGAGAVAPKAFARAGL